MENEIMKIVLKLAKTALTEGNFPSASVLYDPKSMEIIDSDYNTKNTEKDYLQHSEAKVLIKNSKYISSSVGKNNRTNLQLYTSTEPCLMCIGISAILRIDKIFYCIKDINAGASDISIPKKWYKEVYPKIEGGFFENEMQEMLNAYMANKNHYLWRKR